MNRNLIRKSTLVGISSVIAVSVWSSLPASAAIQQSPWESPPQPISLEPSEINTAVYVVFQNLPINLPSSPRMLEGTMMVPGKVMLEGLGYQIQWDTVEQKMTAVHKNRATLTFWAGRHEAAVDGKKLVGIPAAPFIDNQTMWVPLRLAAEASGLTVEWEPFNRTAFVRDPHALPLLSIHTRVDQAVQEQPQQLIEYMEKNMKVTVRFSLIPPEYYRDKTNVMIAAGDMSSIMLLEDPYQYQDMLLESIALNLTPKLEAYPRLKQLADSTAGGRTIDGKQYGIARPGDPHNAPFPAIRKDWLDKLGLAEPRTMEEVYKVLTLFANQDPDGNGKKDTWGMTGYTNEDGLGSFSWVEHAYTGSPDRFSVHNGQVIDHVTTSAQKQALGWLSRAYADGLIDDSLLVQSASQANNQLNSNQAGFAAITLDEAAARTANGVSWKPLSSLKADSSSPSIAPWNTRGNGMYIISTMNKNDPAILLDWLERGIEMSENGQWDEMKSFTAADQSAIQALYGQADLLKNNNSLNALPEAQRKSYEAVVQEWRKTSYEGTTLRQESLLRNNSQYFELNRELNQMKIKVIMGEASIAQWDQYIQQLMESKLYKDMIAELNKLAA